MALFSYVATFGDKHVPGQITATSVEEAIRAYFDHYYPRQRQLLGDAPEIDSRHIVLTDRMEGLRNMWLCQAGRDGRWITAFFAETVA
jgi:hypothetical protein